MIEHFKAQAKVGIPMMLYNIPGRCGGSGMTSATIAEVTLPSQSPLLHGLMESSGLRGYG